MTKEQTGFRNGDIFCFNCGTPQVIPLPMPVTLATSLMDAFGKLHRDCESTWVEPENDTSEKSEQENAIWWLANGEQGISSETMFKYLSDKIPLKIKHFEDTPNDPSDFKRCSLLLKNVPQFKAKLDRMSAVSDVWAKLVEQWDLLETMLEKNDPSMYEFMKKLGC